MILSIYRDPKFNKRLNHFRRQGGVSYAIAKKTDELINRLIRRGRECSHEIGILTKNGEWRIKNCRKYDLGSGYRLICLRKKSNLIFLYIGTHDECSRWLERNKGLDYEIDETADNFISTIEITFINPRNIQENDPADDYEKQLMKNIDDVTLRKIFCGLCTK